MADVPFSTFVAGLALDTIGGSEKIVVVDGSTNGHITPTTLTNFVNAAQVAGAVATPTSGDILHGDRSGTIKTFTLDALASYIVASGWSVAAEVTPATSADKFLSNRSGTIVELDVDTLATYINSAVLDLTALSAATPGASDLFLFGSGATPKNITLANLETQFWSDFKTYVDALAAVTAVAATDQFYVIQGGVAKTVTPVELATYLDVGVGDVTGPLTTTEDKIPQWDSTSKLLKDGLTVATSIRSIAGGAADTAVPTEQAVREALNTLVVDELDIDGMTAIGDDLEDDDLFVVDHGGNGTNRSCEISRIKDYIETAGTFDTLYIDAAAMISCTTNGAAAGSTEIGSSLINLDYYAFDGGATEERVQFRVTMPEDWDRSIIRAKFIWSSATGSSAGDSVEWQIKAVGIGNNDVLDATWGGSQGTRDILLNSNGADLQVSEAVELTVGGSPQLGDVVIFEVYRNTDGQDDMPEDAWLFGVQLQYNRNQTVAEWSPAVSSSPSTSPSASGSSSPSSSVSSSPSTSTSSSPSTSTSSSPSSSPSAT